MRLIFMGTPDFAAKPLQTLLDSDAHEVVLVVSQPDKPVGRKQIMTPPHVKKLALEYGAPTYQPKSLRNEEAISYIKSFSPDAIIVVAYGKILPKEILEIPKYACINLHASLLPKYRGAAPIQWAIINGETETGITSMLMDEGLDTGDILLTKTLNIDKNETAGELFCRLSELCPNILLETLEKLEKNELKPIKQDEAKASYAPILSRDISLIDWNLPALEIHNKIRGLSPWPLAQTEICEKRVKLYSSKIVDEDLGEIKENEVFYFKKGGVFARCGDGKILFLEEVQAENSKRMHSSNFVCGIRF